MSLPLVPRAAVHTAVERDNDKHGISVPQGAPVHGDNQIPLDCNRLLVAFTPSPVLCLLRFRRLGLWLQCFTAREL